MFHFGIERLFGHCEKMDASSSTSSSNEVFSYVFNHIAGENECARTCPAYWKAFPNGMWVTDLPTNNYEPLEVSRGAHGVAKKVGVSLLLLLFKTCPYQIQ